MHPYTRQFKFNVSWGTLERTIEVIVALLVFLNHCGAAKDIKIEEVSPDAIVNIMKTAYSSIISKNQSDVILIVNNGYKKLGGQKMDDKFNASIVVLPNANEERDIGTILTSAFANKIILSRAKRIVVVLLLPRDRDDLKRLLVLLKGPEILLKMNLEHVNRYNKSVGVIDIRHKKEESESALERVKSYLQEAEHHMIQRRIPGAKIIARVIDQDAFTALRKINLETIQNFVHGNLEFSEIQTEINITVNERLKEYMENNLNHFIDRLTLRDPITKLIYAAVEHDCGKPCRKSKGSLHKMLRCCTASIRMMEMTESRLRSYIKYLSAWEPDLWPRFEFELEKYDFFTELKNPGSNFLLSNLVWSRLTFYQLTK